MGNAYLALADDSDSLQWNPAGIARMEYPEVTFMHLAYIADINDEYLGAAFPYNDQAFGFGATWLNVPAFNSTLDPNATLGSASDYSLSLGYAINLSPRLQVGVSARTVLSNLATQSSIGGALDAGATFTPFGRSLSLAVVAQNLGVQSGYSDAADPLPLALRFGAAYSFFDRWDDRTLNLVLDVNKDLNDRLNYNMGAEWWLFHVLAVRGGYQMSEGGQDFSNNDPNAPANFTAGLGFKFGAAQIDYAFVPYGELGVTNRLSLSWKFGFTPITVEPDQVLSSTPKFGKLADAQSDGVVFGLDASKTMTSTSLRKWRVEITDADGRPVRILRGDGSAPSALVWDLRDEDGNAIDADKSYQFTVFFLGKNGRSVRAHGSIAHEIRPKELLDSTPNYDPATGGLVFKPKANLSVGVKEWKLNIRDPEGNILKTITGTGAIPKTLVWKPSTTVGGTNLLAGRTFAAVKYDIEFKDTKDQTSVLSDQVRFALGKAEEQTYKLPLPVREFKVNQGQDILVAALPNLTSGKPSSASGAPFVMPVPKAGVTRSWRFDISDAHGNVVRTFHGMEQIPENIFWDGMDDHGVLVKDPERAHFKFYVLGTEGEGATTERRTIRNPFTIASSEGSVTKISGIWFRFLDTDIQDAVVGKLKEIAALLRRNPKVQVTIQGHAWDEGTPAEALRLSQDRADTVLRYLIEEEDLTPANVSSIGYGEAMPLENARTPDAAAKNRRVEVIIVSKP